MVSVTCGYYHRYTHHKYSKARKVDGFTDHRAILVLAEHTKATRIPGVVVLVVPGTHGFPRLQIGSSKFEMERCWENSRVATDKTKLENFGLSP